MKQKYHNGELVEYLEHREDTDETWFLGHIRSGMSVDDIHSNGSYIYLIVPVHGEFGQHSRLEDQVRKYISPEFRATVDALVNV